MQVKVQIGDVKHGTRISDIEVPERMRHKVPTGIGFLDDCYGGEGLTPGTITLFTGTPGAGKSTLLLQFADAVTRTIVGRQECFGLVNTTEESLYQTKMVSERLFPNGANFYVGEDSIVDDLSAGLHKNVKEAIKLGKAKAILQHMRSLIVQNPDKQPFLFIDSLQTIDDGYYGDGHVNSNTPVRAMQLLTNFAKETFCIVVVVGQVNKSGDFAGKQVVKHLIDCHMHLRIDTNDKSETQGMRIFEMQKNRYGYSGQAYILNCEEHGLYECGSVNKDDQ